ncbi:hypothetical protein MJO52_12800 [Microbulbifer variabilis]|uniref:Uncharacterized protein n=1 Tax=Microbulbifer variabilis TaxID=266805 RepID=A0ABY4V6R2_9GAMM|nr:hypothetical protein [Microbulbifer variabilis]USD19957.1 hypothetical protein MJO52_12800 [Microbulbifer variabilis]
MINLCNTMSGHFRLEVSKRGARGSRIPVNKNGAGHWFKNLILNQGLNKLADSSLSQITDNCHVGSGGTAPAETQTALVLPLANTSNRVETTHGVESSGTPYVWKRMRFEFAEGAAAGNIAELGLGDSSDNNSLFCRALVKDAQGNPTALTVLDDEILSVTYELRIYPPLSDLVGTIELEGVVYDYIARAANIDLVQPNGFQYGWSFDKSARYVAFSSANIIHAYSGPIGAVDDIPSGNSETIQSWDNVSAEAYVANAYQATLVFTAGTSIWNLAGGIRSLALPLGFSAWQIQFTSQVDGSTIPKDADRILKIAVTHSWGRA